MANTSLSAQPKQQTGIATYLGGEAVKKNIAGVIGEKNTARFVTSVVSAVQANPALARCTNQSILSAALLGEALQLTPSPQLGQFYIVPYKNRKKVGNQWIEVEEAQYQLGYKGYLQLAIRSGKYKNIVVSEVKEGELVKFDPITEQIEFSAILDPAIREATQTVGYYAAFKLVNGFEKCIYWSKESMHAHAMRYSRGYRYDQENGKKTSPWSTNFDGMARKTLIRHLIGKWGIMSIEMETAYNSDMSVIDEDGSQRYVDNLPDIDVRVQEDIQANANSEAFEDVMDVQPEETKPAPETTAAPKQTRGKTKKTAEPQPEPTPVNVQPEPAPMPEPEPPIGADDDEMEPFPAF